MTEFHFDWIVIAAFLGIIAWAVVNDCLSYRIPNAACAALVLLYPFWLAVAWPAEDPWLQIAAHAGVALAALVVGFILFILRAFGAGDAKLLAATALWAGPAMILDLVLVTAIAGGVLSLVVILGKRFLENWSPYFAGLQMALAGFATRVLPKLRNPAESAGDSSVGRSGPAHMNLARPIPYGIAIGVGAAVVAYGLLTTSGAT